MQSKLYRKSTILLTLILLLDAAGIVGLIMTRSSWSNNVFMTILLFAGAVFLLSTFYSYYDLNADKNYIKKCVRNGDVAMAKINGGTFVRFGRDAKLKNHVYWKLNVELYDNDMKRFDTTIIEKFSTHQTQIPKGYVFVTYIEGKEDDCLIIPNAIIANIPEYKPLVDDYEKALKPKYLNAFYNMGLNLQTYRDSLAEQKKWQDLDEKYK